ncbi:MAG: hypothetical protein PHE61_05340, partial [Candidatus Omnitrophica bacterium]|nr:hypothetical protein [Candidatus Omnitrophota bacterium]
MRKHSKLEKTEMNIQRGSTFNRLLRTISAVTVFAFTITTVAWSAPALPQVLTSGVSPSGSVGMPLINVPAEYGMIRDVFKPQDKKEKSFLIHIQDAHGHI